MRYRNRPAGQPLVATRPGRCGRAEARGAGGFAHLHLGSVAHHLAHHTRVPLAIVPTSAAGHPVKRIVIGVDGSSGSGAAVAFCAALAPRLAATVVAVYAEEPFVEWVSESATRNWRRHAEAEVRRWVSPIEDNGVPVTVDVDRDVHPVAALSRAIDAEPDTLARRRHPRPRWHHRDATRPRPHPVGAPHRRRRRDGPSTPGR
jgi:nucleotide-binding universal stress UspA family protein